MSITIEFDNPKCEYYPGTAISGNIHVHLEEPKYVRKFSVIIKGKIKNRWTVGRMSYVGLQEVFTPKMIFIEEIQNVELQPGNYKYRFDYLLPDNLPVNWEGSHGSLRYTVKAFIDVSQGFDISRKEEFKIIPVVDLNVIPLARKRFLINKEYQLGIFCCPSGSITLIVTAPRSGYICSETIPLTVDIENNSDCEVYHTEIELCQKIIYVSSVPKDQTRKEWNTLVSGEWPTNILPYGGRQTFQTPLQLKLTEPSTINDAFIIKISYEVKVTCIISGFNLNISEKSRIIIGNVPLNN